MSVTEITKDSITVGSGSLNGNGTFDHFLAAVKAHLTEEFTSQRIRGTDYANVYMGSLNVILQQAVQFELNRQSAALQADLVEAQIRRTEAEIIGINKQNALVDKQILKMDQEILVMEKEVIMADAKIENLQHQNTLIQAQIEKMGKEILLVDEQVLNMQVERQKMNAEVSLMGKQELKLDQDIEVAKQQVLTATEQVNLIKQQVINLAAELNKMNAEIAFTEQKTTNSGQEYFLLQEQVKKAKEEVTYTQQRTKTEMSQIYDTIDGVTVAGQVGRKNTLYTRQADGFLRDAEQKAAKIYTDIWNISKSADPNGLFPVQLLADPTKIDYVTDGNGGEIPRATGNDAVARLNNVLNKMLHGAGVSTSS